ncbi:hypothetical protein [Nonomuraea endophytica]|uniref:Ethanolamine utilization microcompartment shell protein EutL n=1 Tax=Nonomuraea endophytica TaxID=714136 RepID=A0A7W8A5X9_9ACTN|nr:hypothetical protein [Nonomuraea endophytica]MBB5079370.1 ethanolamine utilization microcompartment shell protein EutL [Nonomuraea endophytica]
MKSGPRPAWSAPATFTRCSIWSTTRSALESAWSMNMGIAAATLITPPRSAMTAHPRTRDLLDAARSGAGVRLGT